MSGETFDKENIRDALIHGRWFSDINHNIVCCDSKNGKNNDYNFYWSKTLPLKETVKYCVNYNNQIDHHYKR